MRFLSEFFAKLDKLIVKFVYKVRRLSHPNFKV